MNRARKILSRIEESVEVVAGTRVSVNPRNMDKLLKEIQMTRPGEIRLFCDTSTGDLYAWAAKHEIHNFMAKKMGIDPATITHWAMEYKGGQWKALFSRSFDLQVIQVDRLKNYLDTPGYRRGVERMNQLVNSTKLVAA